MLQPNAAPELAARYASVRAESLARTAHLTAEDMAAQSMPDASPVKWHLAHTSWFFETFLLEPYESGFVPFCADFRELFNSYYNGVGAQFSRPHRGFLTRPDLQTVLAYRRNVDARMQVLIQAGPLPPALVELGLQHEQQHQELMRTDLLHLFSFNPAYPACLPIAPPAAAAAPEGWVAFPATLTQLGHAGPEFCFDNEAPHHRQFLEAFSIAARLVTKREYAAFVADCGYERPEFWLAEGVDFIRREAIAAPLYWRRVDGDWHEFTLYGLRPLDEDAPVTQISYYEADAYARWAGARLPSEGEWEHAAASGQLAQCFGCAWQWTSSAYAPYPGFRAAPDAIGEYNGKFMVNQYVLRGSSLATPAGHERLTYRNFFPTHARWQFSGLRLARSAGY
jgi:ergothioneine biosynthesis protein EgtB